MTTALVNPVRRAVEIVGRGWVVEMSRAGVMFRERGRKTRHVAPWSRVLELAKQLSEQDARRESLRAGAIRRIGRGRGR